MIGAGVVALILLVLILRFAVRPKKTQPAATGLGLNPRGTSARADKPLNTYMPPGTTEGQGVAGSGSSGNQGSGAGAVSAREDQRASSWSAGSTGAARDADHGSFASTASGRKSCPKCGGHFLEGEMEGPTLMVDGVAREEFQPLLTARECSACGYLELYTRQAGV
ncbi:MAG: hypothetical protein ACRDOP_00670 [Gaiellaceae bacterium]